MRMPPGWDTAERVLCVRLDNMGDVLMSTPAMRALAESGAGRRLTLLCSRAGAAVAPFIPFIDETIVHDAAWSKNSGQGSDADRQMVERLARGGYDAAVIFTVYSQSPLPAALMCHLAGIPVALAHCRENPYRLLSHWVRESEPEQGVRHEVQRQLDLVRTVGATTADERLCFASRTADRDAMHAKITAHGIFPGSGWIVAHCGASAASRRYDPDRYAAAFALLACQERPILLTGVPEERTLTAGIAAAAGTGVVDLTGRFSLGELACLIEEADLLISNNTGPAHIAAAVGTPVVDLYALTNPQHTPWKVAHRLLYRDVPCKYCYRSICPEAHHACLDGVEPEEVAHAALELLSAQEQGQPSATIC